MWELLAPQAQRGVALAEPPDGHRDPAELVVYRRNWLSGFAAEIGGRIAKAENQAAAAAGGVGVVRVRRRARRTGHAQRAPEHHDHQQPPLLRPPRIPAGPASRQGRTAAQERGAMSRELIHPTTD